MTPDINQQAPLICQLGMTAEAADGVCALSAGPTLATMHKLSVSAHFSDPYHLFSRASHLTSSPRGDSNTSDKGPGTTLITSPSQEILIQAEGETGIGSTTSITVVFLDPLLLFGQLVEDRHIEPEQLHQPLGFSEVWRFTRHIIGSLVGFAPLSPSTLLTNEYRKSRGVVDQIGEDLSDPLRVKAIVEDFLKNSWEEYCRDAFERKVRTYAVRMLGDGIAEVFPGEIFDVAQSFTATCRGDARMHLLVRPPVRDKWGGQLDL